MRLLLAEDEELLSKALVTILKHNNYSVDAVFDGADALDYIMSGVYDGIILDVMMPKKDGLEVLREAREAGIKTPVLVLTAKTEIDDRVSGLDAGADDYLTKPFATEELLARIRAMTRRRNEKVTNDLCFAGLKLDRSTYELSFGENKLKLVNKEYQIAEFLMSSPGHVVKADLLMDKIWGYDSDSDASVVWVYVSYLRKKIKELGAPVMIKANRGIGYSLENAND